MQGPHLQTELELSAVTTVPRSDTKVLNNCSLTACYARAGNGSNFSHMISTSIAGSSKGDNTDTSKWSHVHRKVTDIYHNVLRLPPNCPALQQRWDERLTRMQTSIQSAHINYVIMEEDCH